MKKILIAEDNSFVSEEIEDILEMEGFNYIHAKNGKEALEMAKRYNPDIILSDILMPGMNGFELYKEINPNFGNPNVPFIFFSAKAEKESLETAKKLGNSDYLVKPVSPEMLIKKIQENFNK